MTKPFSLAFDLPFDEAIAAAKAREVVLPDVYYNVLPMERRRHAYTVSGLTALDQVQAVKDQLTQHLEEGGTLASFQKWAASQSFDLPRHRLETIFRNGVQAAYNAGHWRRFEEDAEDRPYLMYDAINDSRTRPAHRAMDGIIRPVGDPFWQTHAPPNGHRCRCKLISLTEAQAMDRSRDGRGLSQPVTPEMRADDAGWGRKPTEWSETLKNLEEQKLERVAPQIGSGYAEVEKRAPLLIDPAADLPDCDGFQFSVFTFAAPGCIGPVEGQKSWRQHGRIDLRHVDESIRLEPPAMLESAGSDRPLAAIIMADALSMSEEVPLRVIKTPIESALILLDKIPHMVEKEADARERYANFIIPTLEDPFEIWGVKYNDGAVRNRYIGLFRGLRDLLVAVRVNADGSILWNVMQSDSKSLNKTRIGVLMHGK